MPFKDRVDLTWFEEQAIVFLKKGEQIQCLSKSASYWTWNLINVDLTCQDPTFPFETNVFEKSCLKKSILYVFENVGPSNFP